MPLPAQKITVPLLESLLVEPFQQVINKPGCHPGGIITTSLVFRGYSSSILQEIPIIEEKHAVSDIIAANIEGEMVKPTIGILQCKDIIIGRMLVLQYLNDPRPVY